MEVEKSNTSDIAVIGGGAAGFFTAITVAELHPASRITIYEKGSNCLSKVKISGGGRCNVTHSCFDPALLSGHYPRGARELRGCFHTWQASDTVDWFAARGVELKAEADGRMFPVTNSSQTIIDCFSETARKLGVEIKTNITVKTLVRAPDGKFEITLKDGTHLEADYVCLTSGSLKVSPLVKCIEAFGHTIEPLVPSLFSVNVKSEILQGLAGLSVQNASVKLIPKSPIQTGPLLITHRGLSGPAILRLSAWEARRFADAGYHTEISVNWLGSAQRADLLGKFSEVRASSGKSLLKNRIPIEIPRRLWERFLQISGVESDTQWSQLPKDKENTLLCLILDTNFVVDGKTTNKDEFVTCGGVKRKEVDFRSMQSKLVEGLYFAGECLDIDGITGGFNFQAAWTTARIAGSSMASKASRSGG